MEKKGKERNMLLGLKERKGHITQINTFEMCQSHRETGEFGVPHFPNAPLISTLPQTDGGNFVRGHLSPAWRDVHSEVMKAAHFVNVKKSFH